jgi:hypothetical protein
MRWYILAATTCLFTQHAAAATLKAGTYNVAFIGISGSNCDGSVGTILHYAGAGQSGSTSASQVVSIIGSMTGVTQQILQQTTVDLPPVPASGPHDWTGPYSGSLFTEDDNQGTITRSTTPLAGTISFSFTAITQTSFRGREKITAIGGTTCVYDATGTGI